MLNISFATNQLTEDEARGLVNLITTLYPFQQQISDQVKAADAVTMNIDRAQVAAAAEQPAPDGFPVDSTAAVDSAGVPWDARIHTSNRATKQDGTWKRRPGIDDAVFAAVSAELQPRPAPITEPEETSAAEAFGAAPPPPPVAAPVPTPPPAAPAPTAGAPSFMDLMPRITALQQAGKLDLPTFLKECNLENVAKLVTADEGTRIAVSMLLDSKGA